MPTRWRSRVACVLALAAGLAASGSRVAHAQTCTTSTLTMPLESFEDVATRAPGSSVDGWGAGEITLAAKGDFFSGTTNSVGVRLMSLVSGDWNGDGLMDFVAHTLTPSCHMHYYRNLGMNTMVIPAVHNGFSAGGASGTPGFNAYNVSTAPAGCGDVNSMAVAGDYDGDGDRDVIYLGNTNATAPRNTLKHVTHYEFTSWSGAPSTGFPNFSRTVISANFTGASEIHTSWEGPAYTESGVIDWDQDGKDDFLVANMNDTVNQIRFYRSTSMVGAPAFAAPINLIPDGGFTPSFLTTAADAGSGCEPSATNRSRGITGFAIADFDGDGDRDFILASVSERRLTHFANDGTDFAFTRKADISFAEGGANVVLPADFDRDGDVDLIIARDGWNCGGNGGSTWFMRNDGTGAFTKVQVWAGTGADLDVGLSMDMDGDGNTDFLVSDGNNSGNYYATLTSNSDVFNLSGAAYSNTIDTLSNATEAIVSVTMTRLVRTLEANTSVDYFVSNDGGRSWEPLTPEQVASGGTPGAPHEFVSFGADFRWRAELRAREEVLVGDRARFAPGSTKTPRIQELAFSYDHVDRRRYSRSAPAYLEFTSGGTDYEILVSSSFYYPGFEGNLVTYDISNLPETATANIERIDNHASVAVLAEAGDVLAARAGDSRMVYAAYPSGGTPPVASRVELTTANLSSTSPTLETMMGVTPANGATVVSFVRDGMASLTGHKFYDPGHSSPIFVGAPFSDAATATYLGTGYETFALAVGGREPTLYIGANDGMLHAFDPVTGEERWGLAPYNLLSKLQLQRRVDALGNAVYQHEYFVDGELTVHDVYDSSTSEWRTILIGGQAKGKGRGDSNYYFGVDITDPLDPQPLWEFTDSFSGVGASCSGVTPCHACLPVIPPEVCTPLCTETDHEFQETPGPEIWIEAEQFNTEQSLDGSHHYIVQADAAASGGSKIVGSPNGSAEYTGSPPVGGAVVSYDFVVTTPANYYLFARNHNGNVANNRHFHWSIDGTYVAKISTTTSASWRWNGSLAPVFLDAGQHTLRIYMAFDGGAIDKILLKTNNTAIAGATLGSAPVCRVCTTPPPIPCPNNPECEGGGACVPGCASGREWPECGAGLECCGSPGSAFCAPLNECATTVPDTVLGETWSAPAFARVRIGGAETWVVFFGSGYANVSEGNVGRSLYVIHAVSGELLGRWDTSELSDLLPNTAPTPDANMPNALPGGVSVVDRDNDGFADAAYIGDLEGRLWRLDVTPNAVRTSGMISNWTMSNIFDAGLPGGTGSRIWAPIITTPAIAVLDNVAYLYFGTGGDDRAPGAPAVGSEYTFFAVRDDVVANGSTVRYDGDLDGAAGEWALLAESGHKFWSDPVIVNGAIVYMASLSGTIETVNPCADATGGSNVYGVAIREFSANLGDGVFRNFSAGQSILWRTNAGGGLESAAYHSTNSKVRQVMVPGAEQGLSVARPIDTAIDPPPVDVFIQEFTGAGVPQLDRLIGVDVAPTASTRRLRILQWRDVPL